VKDGNNPTYLYGYARKVIEEGGRRRAEGRGEREEGGRRQEGGNYRFREIDHISKPLHTPFHP
jgi:hypothetical protein